MGMPNPPKATGAVLAISDTVTAFRAETQAQQKERRDGHGRPEPCAALEQRPKAKGHQDGLYVRIAGSVARHPLPQLLEAAAGDREVVKP